MCQRGESRGNAQWGGCLYNQHSMKVNHIGPYLPYHGTPQHSQNATAVPWEILVAKHAARHQQVRHIMFSLCSSQSTSDPAVGELIPLPTSQ